MFDPRDPYVQFLRHRCDSLFHIKPYIGNSGDVLIRMGTEVLLGELGIKTTRDPRRADVILWPGGNPSMWPGNGWAEALESFSGKNFIIGPATFQFSGSEWPAMLNRTKARVIGVFARDRESLQNLRRAGLPDGIETGLSHDPALHLRGSTWANEHREAATEEFVLACFRGDHEAKEPPLQRVAAWIQWMPRVAVARIDRKLRQSQLQRRLRQVDERRPKDVPLRIADVSLFDFESFVEWVRRSKEVHTDRLHCMLLAVLLEKPVRAYPTAYGKLEAVFQQSLKGWADVDFAAS